MRHLVVHFLVFSLVFVFPGFAAADDFQWIFQKGEKKWLPQLELTGRPGNNDLYGMEIDPFIPIAQNDHSLIFLNVRNSLFWEDGDFSHEFNAGGGYRRLMGDNSWILGGYGFFDRLDSRYDNTFNQGTLGVEALAWDWDARVNGYITGNSSKSAPGAGGSKVTLSGTSLSMKTMQEQALSGVDGEIGYRLPFFGDDGVFSDMRIYAGGFFFDNNHVDSIAGPSARFEARIWEVPFLPEESRVTLGANYRWDSVRNSHVEGIVALRVPLGRPNRSTPLTHLERRMTDRVVRDVNIVTNTGLGKKEAVVTRTGIEIDEAYFFEQQQEVFSRGLEISGDGSFDDPFSLANAVATGENNLLIGLARNGDVFSVDTQLRNGQTVLGGGMPLYVWGAESGDEGVWVAPGQAATLTGFGENEAAFLLAENNTIAGLFFRGGQEECTGLARGLDCPMEGGGGTGSLGQNGYALELNLDGQTTMADIYNNHFSQLEHAIEVDARNDSGLQMYAWNNFFERMDNGLDVYAPGTFDLKFDVYGNQFANLGNGLDFALFPDGSDGASSFQLNAWDNIFSDNDAGIVTYVRYSGSEDYTHNSYIGGNRFWSNSRDDYELTIEGSDPTGAIDVNVELADNESLNGDTFADIELDPIPNGQVSFNVHNNYVSGTGEGIEIDVDFGPDVNVMISENEIIGAWDGDAINVDIHDSGDVNITVNDNWIENTFDDDGIDIHVLRSDDTMITVADNTVIDTGNDGGDNAIAIEIDGIGSADSGNVIMVSGNTVEFVNGGNGIDVDVDDSADTNIEITDNSISAVDDGDGIKLRIEDTGNSTIIKTVLISENTVLDVGDDGIDVEFNSLNTANQITTLTIADNTVRRAGDNGSDTGIEVDLNNVNDATVLLEGNTVEESGDGTDGNGVRIELSGSNLNTITLAENDISRSGEHGVEVDLEGNSEGNVIAINDNEILLSNENGIDIYVENGSDGNRLSISGNEISYVEDGIQIDSFDATTVLESTDDNIVTYFLEAADFDGTGTGTILVNGVEVPIPN